MVMNCWHRAGAARPFGGRQGKGRQRWGPSGQAGRGLAADGQGGFRQCLGVLDLAADPRATPDTEGDEFSPHLLDSSSVWPASAARRGAAAPTLHPPGRLRGRQRESKRKSKTTTRLDSRRPKSNTTVVLLAIPNDPTAPTAPTSRLLNIPNNCPFHALCPRDVHSRTKIHAPTSLFAITSRHCCLRHLHLPRWHPGDKLSRITPTKARSLDPCATLLVHAGFWRKRTGKDFRVEGIVQ